MAGKGRKWTDLKIYEERHNIAFPNNLIKVVKREGNFIYFETEFGLCKKQSGNIGKFIYNIESAINKTDYLKRQLFKKYRNKFDLTLVKINNSTKEKIILICNIHGKFSIVASSATHKKCNCPICSQIIVNKINTSNNQEFIQKANIIHNNKYDYSLVKYKNYKEKLIINCPKHGQFLQSPAHHLIGYEGCKKCLSDKKSNIQKPICCSWTLENWDKFGQKSKNFDSFKVYIIRCWNEDEEFYKIGRTYQAIKKRFDGKTSMPYNYEVIKIYKDTSENMYNLENDLKKLNKKYKYLPKIDFAGKYECFTKIEDV